MLRLAPAALAALLLTGCAGETPIEGPEGLPTAGMTVPPSPGPSASPSPSSTSPTPEPTETGTVIELTYAGGEVSGDTGRVEVPLGATVVLRVTSDVVEQVHVHGVDEYVDLAAGETTESTFVADVPGVFELELHGAGTLLTRMQVQ